MKYSGTAINIFEVALFAVASYDHSEHDCFGCAILSHGREGLVYAKDGQVSLDLLVLPFKGDRCPSLIGKPKLFFIQVITSVEHFLTAHFNCCSTATNKCAGRVLVKGITAWPTSGGEVSNKEIYESSVRYFSMCF